MSTSKDDDLLLMLSKAAKSKINDLKNGANIERTTGKAIEHLQNIALQDRLILAKKFLVFAKTVSLNHSTQNRLIIARAYYAFYHTARTFT